ncbi:30S ribosomal protein S15 [archaeon]|nr:30S ribosomal protein S15 [archaeon]
MSRLFSGAKGRHGSRKPLKKVKPEWVELKPKQVEELVVSLANQGNSKSVIGGLLRDQYGIPDAKIAAGKTIKEMLEENKLGEKIPEDLLSLIKQSVTRFKHLSAHKKDQTARLGYNLCVAKIKRLGRYYRKKGVLPVDWRYSPETAALLVK